MTAPAALRAAAATIVHAVAVDGKSLDAAIEAGMNHSRDTRDRALIRALSYETLRWHVRLDAAASHLLGKPLRRRDAVIRSLILVGLAQLERMRIPEHAAVAETVEAAKLLRRPRAAGLVNAVLRRFQRDRDSLGATLDAEPSTRFAMPAWIVERLQNEWPDDVESILAACNAHPPMWLRVNLAETDVLSWRRRADLELSLGAEPSPHAPAAVRLAEPVDVQALPGFADGLVSVQDAAAQLATGLVDAQPGMRVLDACAAPGGKSCAILEAASGPIELTALDLSAQRLAKVGDNLHRLKLEARLIAGNAADPSAWWDGRPYERILLDAPCTASGVIRRHPDIRLLRRPGDVAKLATEQRGMLVALWPLLAPGGRLVYATCSMFRAENADVVDSFVAQTADAVVDSDSLASAGWGRVSGAGRQILPGEAGMDGFYYACLSRTPRPS